MKFLLCLLMIATTPLQAQKNVGSHIFQVSVKPLLSNILSDFYQMITQFPDFPKDLLPILAQVGDLQTEQEIIKEKCPRLITRDCLGPLNTLRTKLSVLQNQTMLLLSQQNMSSQLYMSNIGGIRTINEFQAEISEVKAELDNSSFMIMAEVKHRLPTMHIIKQLDLLNTYFSLTVVEFIPYLYKEDFRHFYFNFINPLQKNIAKRGNHEFFHRSIGTLNFALNLLNQNLTKRSKKTPEGMVSYLALMHNRWNNILRYYY
jgi:hypothetical protein